MPSPRPTNTWCRTSSARSSSRAAGRVSKPSPSTERTDSNPIGRLFEQFDAAAFEAHPYHRPTVGWMSDLNSFSATDAKKFFDEYYVPANMVVAVAGDVKAAHVMPILEKYFRRPPGEPQAG